MFCYECHGYGKHLTGCPYQEDNTPVFHCNNCHAPIYEDDEYLETDDGQVCYGCLQNMSPLELLGLVDKPIQYAHAEAV